MDDLTGKLRAAFTDAGYDVGETSRNRNRIRITVLDPEASGGALRDLTYEVVDESAVAALNVKTESEETQEPVTVVSFRYRS